MRRYPGENCCGSIFGRGQPYHWISRSVRIAVSRSVTQGSWSLDFSSDLWLSGSQTDNQWSTISSCKSAQIQEHIKVYSRKHARKYAKQQKQSYLQKVTYSITNGKKTFATYSLVLLICPPHDPYITTTKDHKTWGQTDWRSDPIISHLGGRRGRGGQLQGQSSLKHNFQKSLEVRILSLYKKFPMFPMGGSSPISNTHDLVPPIIAKP